VSIAARSAATSSSRIPAVVKTKTSQYIVHMYAKATFKTIMAFMNYIPAFNLRDWNIFSTFHVHLGISIFSFYHEVMCKKSM
jgi:myo-inositol-1-phosphate synthase